MESFFRRLKIRKAAGPDNISARLLKTCASQLSDVFCKLFNWSLNDSTVPSVWKHSEICPVPKKNKHFTLNDYRPVVLTSVVMKCFKKFFFPVSYHEYNHRQIPNSLHTRETVEQMTQH